MLRAGIYDGYQFVIFNLTIFNDSIRFRQCWYTISLIPAKVQFERFGQVEVEIEDSKIIKNFATQMSL